MDKLAFSMANKFYDVSGMNFEIDKKEAVKVRGTFKGHLAIGGVMAATIVLAIPALILLPIVLVGMYNRYKECKELLKNNPQLRDIPIEKMTAADVVASGLHHETVRTYKFVRLAERHHPLIDQLEEERAEQHAIEVATVKRRDQMTVQ